MSGAIKQANGRMAHYSTCLFHSHSIHCAAVKMVVIVEEANVVVKKVFGIAKANVMIA